MSIRVVLADDHRLVRTGIKALLEAEGFSVVGEADNGHDVIELTQRLKPDIVLVDVLMPQLTGIEVAEAIANGSNPTKVILMSMNDDDEYILRGLRAGVVGYVLKWDPTELGQTIRKAFDGGRFLGKAVTPRILERLSSSLTAESSDCASTPCPATLGREAEPFNLTED